MKSGEYGSKDLREFPARNDQIQFHIKGTPRYWSEGAPPRDSLMAEGRGAARSPNASVRRAAESSPDALLLSFGFCCGGRGSDWHRSAEARCSASRRSEGR